MAPPLPITMLSSLNTLELTVTKRGINGKRFAMTKGGLPMEPEVLQALMSTPIEGEKDFIATLKSAGVTDQKQIDAAVASLRVQKGMKDLVPSDTMLAVAKAAGYADVAKAVTPNEGVRDDKTDAESGKVDPKTKKKDPLGKSVNMSGMSAEDRSTLEQMFKSNQELVAKSAQLEETIKSMRDEQETKQYVAKAAADFDHLPMGSEELGMMLKSAHASSSDFAKGFEKLLGTMNELVKKSSMFTSMGAVAKSQSGGAWQKIEALADGMVQKSAEGGKSLTKAQAIDVVLKSEQGAALYREYLGDNPRQRAEIY